MGSAPTEGVGGYMYSYILRHVEAEAVVLEAV